MENNLPTKYNDSLFTKISDTKSPQGIIAVCELPQNKIKLNAKESTLSAVFSSRRRCLRTKPKH